MIFKVRFQKEWKGSRLSRKTFWHFTTAPCPWENTVSYWLRSWLYLCLLSQPNEQLGWFFTSSGRANNNFIMCQNSFVLKGTGVKLPYFYSCQYLIKCPFISFVFLLILIMAMFLKYLTEFIHSYFLLLILNFFQDSS